MQYQESFIMSYYSVCDKKMRLNGRVLRVLKVGDILFPANHGNIIKNHGLTIERINAYQHEFDEIDGGMTCELLVCGKDLYFEHNCIFYSPQNST